MNLLHLFLLGTFLYMLSICFTEYMKTHRAAKKGCEKP